MKKVLITLVLSVAAVVSVGAQDVFKMLLEDSKRIAEDGSKDIETRKIATFKYDELCYMAMQVRDDVLRDTTNLDLLNATVDLLNHQSLAMHEFVTFYLEELSFAQKKADRDAVVLLFKGASINNPLFNDMDKELILSYYDNDKYATPFSLDTNWVEALKYVREKRAGRGDNQR